MAPAGKFASPANLHNYNQPLQAALKRLDTVYDGNRDLRRTRKSIGGMKEILRRIGDPQKKLSAVHITGSKGKGSTATLVTAGLLEASFIKEPVGTYVGPHVLRVNERIQCNGHPISDDQFADSLNRVMDAIESSPPVRKVAHYDVLAATGFDAMCRMGCKWVVVEVVIGGRLDVTNVLSAPVVVITNIYLEHTDIMGPSLENIAREKAGIISAGAHVICGMRRDDPLSEIFIKEANQLTPGAQVSFLPPETGSCLLDKNVSLARAALESVAQREEGYFSNGKSLLSLETARKAMNSMPGRQETFIAGKRRTPIVLDGAHVAESLGMVLDEMIAVHRDRALVVVLAVGKDKDAHSICTAIRNRNPLCVIATDAGKDGPGSLVHASDLKNVLVGVNVECLEAIQDMRSALIRSLELAASADIWILCTGTMKIVSEMRPFLAKEHSDYRKVNI